jgi:hypothetical protein
MTGKATDRAANQMTGETTELGSDLIQIPRQISRQSLQPPLQQRLIEFLEHDLAIPMNAINLGLRHQEQSLPLSDQLLPNLLPMVLWQYGLLTLEQLDQVFEWLETA